MSFRLLPPDLKDCKSYEVYQKELAIWETITDIPKEKRGAILAARLPNESKLKKDLKDKFFESVDTNELAKEGGLKLVKEFLEKELGEDNLEKQIRTWDSFEDCTRGTKNIEEFLSDYDRAYKKAAAAAKIVIPASVRAFMVLKRANIDRTQRMLVLSKLDKSDEMNMFDNMCKELKIVLGSVPGANKSDLNAAIKIEPYIPSEEVLYAAGYYRRGGGQVYRDGRGDRYSGRDGYTGHGSKNHGEENFEHIREQDYYYEKPRRKMNRPDDEGNPTTCYHCGSKFHYLNMCPDRDESVKLVTHDENAEANIILFTDDRAELSQFKQEALNCASLDTCCSSTVSGKEWLDIYLNSMEKTKREKVQGPFKSDKIFRFGNNGKLPSEGRYLVPATLAGTNVTIGMDVIDSDIPLLLSKQAMKKAGMKIDIKNDTATAFGNEEQLITTAGGHYCMPLLGLPMAKGFNEKVTVDREAAVRVSVNRISKQGYENAEQTKKDESMKIIEDKSPGIFEIDKAEPEEEVEEIDELNSMEMDAVKTLEDLEIKKRSRMTIHYPTNRAEKNNLKEDDLALINVDEVEWLRIKAEGEVGLEKVEHMIVKDEFSEESGDNEELDLAIKEMLEVGCVCNFPACEKPKYQVSEEVEVGELVELFTDRAIIDNKATMDARVAVHTTSAVFVKKVGGDIGVLRLITNEGDVTSTLAQFGEIAGLVSRIQEGVETINQFF